MRREFPRDPITALKAQLGQLLAALLNGGNADDVAWSIGTDRARVSELRRGQLKRFSLETLIRYVDRLNHRVNITVTHAPPNYRRNSRRSDASRATILESTDPSPEHAATNESDRRDL